MTASSVVTRGGPIDLDDFIATVQSRNPGEPEFAQAVTEVAESVVPYINTQPDYYQNRVLQRMTEPDRIVIFRVAWQDDEDKPIASATLNVLIEPIDDLRAGNPPTNPELLDYLTREFIESGFNTRHVLELICSSRVYQLSIASNRCA